MQDRVLESDWKAFRKLQEAALDRFCEHVLQEAERTIEDDSHSNHDRYLALYRLLKKRDKEIGRAFNDPQPSQMFIQLLAIDRLGLIEPEEM